MPVWRGMFCSWLPVQADQLANWESFWESRELLSHHCSLAGCTRGLGRHQTGNTQQVEAMDVYLAPFIKAQKPDREVRTQKVKQGSPSYELHVATVEPSKGHRGLDLGFMVPKCGWGVVHHPMAGSPHPFLQSSRSLAYSWYSCTEWWH